MKQWSTMDAFKAGWLKYLGYEPNMIMKEKERVVFIFNNSKEIQSHLEKYDLPTTTVQLEKYVRSVKSVKSAMHTYLMEYRDGQARRG